MDKQAQAQRYALAVYQAMLEQWQSALTQVEAVLSKDQALAATVKDAAIGRWTADNGRYHTERAICKSHRLRS